MSQPINPLSSLAAAPGSARPARQREGNWFEAMAEAWGETLDKQAHTIEDLAAQVREGDDSPATVSMMTAQSLRMGYLTSSSHTGLTSVSSALETMARKQ